MAEKILICVLGATGNQGGSVIDAMLSSKARQQKYALRGITRNASSGSAKALSAKGKEYSLN
jgi:ribose 1,5-bisphosphokinase PhnN